MKLKTKRNITKLGMEGGENSEEEPVSPTSQYFNSSVLCGSILVVFESEIPIVDDSMAVQTLENTLLPVNTRFSSVMVKDHHGIAHWKRVKVNLEDHVKIPIFPAGLEYYDDCFQDYLSKLATEFLPQDRPLWEAHIIKYPTKNAAGFLVFKIHHSLGDGFSLMAALFNCLRRADDPSLPLTFPSRKEPSQGRRWAIHKNVSRAVSMCINTAYDFAWSLTSSLREDSRTPIRSGEPGLESRPITLSTVTFSLSSIKQIKTMLKGTVNDVITGIIFHGIQLYLQAAGQGTKHAKVSALVMLNTRTITSYQSLQYMNQPNSKALWGNHFTFLHVPIPSCLDADKANPQDSIRHAKKIIKAKRNSLGVYLTAAVMELLRKIKGHEAVSRYIHNTLCNTSMAISSLIGPIEQMQIADHPVKSMYFMMARNPQSLMATVVSYMGEVKVAFGAERDFINSELLVSCMEKSFEKIFEATIGKKT